MNNPSCGGILMIVEIFSIPGIVRLRFDRLYKNKCVEDNINFHLKKLNGIKYVKANSTTGKILVKYKDISVQEIKNEILKKYFMEKPHKNKSIFEPEDLPLKTQITLTALSGAAIFYTCVKQVLIGKSPLTKHYGLLSLSSVISIISGYPIFKSGFEHFFNRRKINGDMMVTVATFVVLMLRESIIGLIVVFLVNLSILMHTLTIHYNKKALKEFLSLKPGRVWMVLGGKEIGVHIDDVNKGDILSIHSGEVVPFDGTIAKGDAYFDESSITGKILYIKKRKGDKVFATSKIVDGNIQIIVDSIEDEQNIQDLYELIELESRKKFTTNIADLYIEKLIPLSFLITGIVSYLTNDIIKGISSLLVLCPCSFAHGSSSAYGVAVRNAAKRGILIKNSSSIENMSELDVCIFDKTGTLTEGRPNVSGIYPVKGFTVDYVLRMASSAEKGIIQPTAISILKEANDNGIKPLPSFKNREIDCIGASSYVEGKLTLVGNRRFIERNGININNAKNILKRLEHLNQSAVFVVQEDKIIGLIGVKDVLKKGALDAVEKIRAYGILDILLVSGDDSEETERVANELGIESAIGALMPKDKKEIVLSYKKQNKTVAMIGDGINDIPAIKEADIGIVLGRPSSRKMVNTLDVAIIDENPLKIVELIDLSKYTKKVIRQNHILSTTLSIAEYIYTLMGKVNPFAAAILHNINSLTILINSYKIYNYSIKRRRIDGEYREGISKGIRNIKSYS